MYCTCRSGYYKVTRTLYSLLQKSYIKFLRKSVHSLYMTFDANFMYVHLRVCFIARRASLLTGGCTVKGVSKTSLALASSFLGVEADELEDALVSRVMMPKGGSSKGTVIKYVRPSVSRCWLSSRIDALSVFIICMYSTSDIPVLLEYKGYG